MEASIRRPTMRPQAPEPFSNKSKNKRASKSSSYLDRIHFRIEKDVFNLRNRVRLLELEHKRAMKKITEASERAQYMADLKAKND